MKRVFALTILALALAATPASAQTLGELGGTIGLIDTLAGGSVPGTSVPAICSPTTLPDLDADGNVIPREETCTGTGTQTQTQTTTQTAPPESTAPSAHANGYYCKPLKRPHFSRCVTAMAKVREGSSPATACKRLGRKRVKGLRGTPFGRCVSGARRLQRDLAA